MSEQTETDTLSISMMRVYLIWHTDCERGLHNVPLCVCTFFKITRFITSWSGDEIKLRHFHVTCDHYCSLWIPLVHDIFVRVTDCWREGRGRYSVNEREREANSQEPTSRGHRWVSIGNRSSRMGQLAFTVRREEYSTIPSDAIRTNLFGFVIVCMYAFLPL